MFLNERDIAFWKGINKEAYRLFFIKVKVSKVVLDSYNSTYNESPNRKYADPYEVEAYIPDLPGWQNSTTKFGMDETRNLIMYFSIDVLNETGFPYPDIGDYIYVQDDTYKVVQTNPTDYKSNLQIPLSHVCELKRVHYENPDEGNAVHEENY